MAIDDRAIVARGLTKRYGGQAVVDNLSFEIERGACLAVLGPNGAGKTTTIEMLEGLRAPDSGQIRVLGLDPVSDAFDLMPRIGVMLQEGGVYPSIRPIEILRLYASFFATPAKPAALLELVDLEESASTPYRHLSGGQKQRLSFALALVGRPELLFLDEPTAGMDPSARRATWAVIEELKSNGATVVLTTHFLEEADRLADQVAIIHRGRLEAIGAPESLRRETADIIHFKAEPGLALHGLAALLDATGVHEERPGEYEVSVQPTPPKVAALTGWLAERGVLLTDLRTGARSLEDAYLRLTQRTDDDDAINFAPGTVESDA